MSTTEYKALFEKAKQVHEALIKLEKDIDFMSEKLMRISLDLAEIKNDFDFIQKKPKRKTNSRKARINIF